MSKTLALFFFFFCLQFIAQNTAAQDLIVYDEVKRFNWNLQTEPEEFQTMVSQFNLKSNVLGFEVTYHGQLIKKESNTYQIHLLFDQFSSISDLNYRGFELTPWLYSSVLFLWRNFRAKFKKTVSLQIYFESKFESSL